MSRLQDYLDRVIVRVVYDNLNDKFLNLMDMPLCCGGSVATPCWAAKFAQSYGQVIADAVAGQMRLLYSPSFSVKFVRSFYTNIPYQTKFH